VRDGRSGPNSCQGEDARGVTPSRGVGPERSTSLKLPRQRPGRAGIEPKGHLPMREPAGSLASREAAKQKSAGSL
jgi:hypothetical protein